MLVNAIKISSIDKLMTTHKTTIGTTCSIIASALFAVLYYYYQFLPEVPGNDIYAWRIVFSSIFISALFILPSVRRDFVTLTKKMRQNVRLLLTIIATSQLLALQLWLFMWAPVNGFAMDVSVGYFLLPLTLAVTGKIVFGEVFGKFKLLSFLVACGGFGFQLMNGQMLSWPTLTVCLGYPIYYVIRRKSGSDNVAGFIMDIYLNLPMALFILLSVAPILSAPQINTVFVLAGLGIISTLALLLMIVASQKLDLIVFGLMNYIEPVLLVAVAILVGQFPSREHTGIYVCVALSVLILIVEGMINLIKNRKASHAM